jgi:hypothetical protein
MVGEDYGASGVFGRAGTGTAGHLAGLRFGDGGGCDGCQR